MTADRIAFWFPVVVTAMYAATAAAHAHAGRWPWALTWGAYAAANVGLIWASMRP